MPKPKDWTKEQYEEHVAEAQAVAKARAAVEKDHVDYILRLEQRVEALEHKKPATPAAAAKKARK
jgi:hypothetical protein